MCPSSSRQWQWQYIYTYIYIYICIYIYIYIYIYMLQIFRSIISVYKLIQRYFIVACHTICYCPLVVLLGVIYSSLYCHSASGLLRQSTLLVFFCICYIKGSSSFAQLLLAKLLTCLTYFLYLALNLYIYIGRC